MSFRYVWLIWSSAFLVPWALLWWWARDFRAAMLRASIVTALFGLTQPLFVPAYWNPPSVFNLAQKTGFDLESLIFCFAIGGVGAVLYNALTHHYLAQLSSDERKNARHRWHLAALFAPIPSFLLLYWLPWNPIYSGITAMVLGATAAVLCRPDLATKTLLGGLLFFGYYSVFMLGLLWITPGYIESVWNLPALSNIRPLGIPLEELLFGFAFGLYWTGVYEHFTWRRGMARGQSDSPMSVAPGG